MRYPFVICRVMMHHDYVKRLQSISCPYEVHNPTIGMFGYRSSLLLVNLPRQNFQCPLNYSFDPTFSLYSTGRDKLDILHVLPPKGE